GTSGAWWLYPDTRWDRESYFLPYAFRSGQAIQREFQDGVQGCMFYQGPVSSSWTNGCSGPVLGPRRTSRIPAWMPPDGRNIGRVSGPFYPCCHGSAVTVRTAADCRRCNEASLPR